VWKTLLRGFPLTFDLWTTMGTELLKPHGQRRFGRLARPGRLAELVDRVPDALRDGRAEQRRTQRKGLQVGHELDRSTYMAICANCGFSVSNEMRYCPRCGTPARGEGRGARRPGAEIAVVAPEQSDDEYCQIDYWHGYVRSDFGARGLQAQGEIARSPLFRWWRAEPPRPEGNALEAYQLLVGRLREVGWTPVGNPHPWYAQRFRRPAALDEPASPAGTSEPDLEDGGC
jgi:hypothetical protein